MTLAAAVSQAALTAYFEGLGKLLGRVERRASFAMYAAGLLSDLERKSVEPIAALASNGSPKRCALYHHRLLHLLNTSPWSDEDVRGYAADYALRALTEDEPVEAWSLDDTGFLKQGDDSVGVQRQYTGSAGKVTNCQVAVSLTVATRTAHLPIDMDLYLPEDWAKDAQRRHAAKVPDAVAFRTKHGIALDLIAKAVLADVPRGHLLADSAYGSCARLRGEVTALGFSYALGVLSSVVVRRFDACGRRLAPTSAKALAEGLRPKHWREVTWLTGTKAPLRSRFALVEVEVENPDPNEPARQRLLIEWPEGDEEPTHYTLVTLPAERGLREVVRITKARWRVERTYEDLKGELGLDHYEGRSWVGWQHHVSAVLACYALVVACQRRAFPPSATRAREVGALEGATCAPLR
jgi:SRSO17 transposase